MAAFVKAYLCPASLRREKVRSDLAARNPGAIIQTVRPDGIRNEFFLEMIAAQTMLAEWSGSLLARKPELDLLLRLGRTSQISTAISTVGAREGEPFMAVVAGRGEVSVPGYLEPLELARGALTKGELEMIEAAALLDAERA